MEESQEVGSQSSKSGKYLTLIFSIIILLIASAFAYYYVTQAQSVNDEALHTEEEIETEDEVKNESEEFEWSRPAEIGLPQSWSESKTNKFIASYEAKANFKTTLELLNDNLDDVAIALLLNDVDYPAWRRSSSENGKEFFHSLGPVPQALNFYFDGKTLAWDSRVVWKNDGVIEGEHIVHVIENPESLKYAGLGIFYDDSNIYSVGVLPYEAPGNSPSYGTNDLDPKYGIKILGSLIINGPNTYYLEGSMAARPSIVLADSIDQATARIHPQYPEFIVDKDSLHYNKTELVGINPYSFRVVRAEGSNNVFFVANDNQNDDFIYMTNSSAAQKLEGITHETMEYIPGYVVRDGDNVWVNQIPHKGGISMEKIDPGELESYLEMHQVSF